MKKIVLLLIVPLIYGASFAQRLPVVKGYKDILDKYFAVNAAMKNFNGNILIAKNDTILYQKSIGMANYEYDIPIDFNSKIKIASLTKTFTSAAIIMLIKEGKLSLTQTIDKFIRDFPSGNKITIADLLMHQSGAPDPDFAALNFIHHLSADDVLQTIKSQPLKFEPGSKYAYSNGGYFLLAYIVERVSGQSFGSFLKEKIFNPLNMNDSGVFEDEPIIKNRASSYAIGPNNEYINMDWYSSEPSMGSGYLYSTINDLYKWCKAVKNKTLVDFYSQQYPYGWGRRKSKDTINYIEQSGYKLGEQGLIEVYENGYYIIYNSNLSNLLFNKVYNDVPAILFGGTYNMPVVSHYITLPDSALTKFCGHYHFEGHADFKILLNKGSLFYKWDNDPFPRYLVPLTDKSFEMREEFSNISFNIDKSGKVDYLTISFGSGPGTVCTKIN